MKKTKTIIVAIPEPVEMEMPVLEDEEEEPITERLPKKRPVTPKDKELV
tara:strand:+ start:84 stop:230 length:147 start_codon:yes stop_codon:yes gene_type:complete